MPPEPTATRPEPYDSWDAIIDDLVDYLDRLQLLGDYEPGDGDTPPHWEIDKNRLLDGEVFVVHVVIGEKYDSLEVPKRVRHTGGPRRRQDRLHVATLPVIDCYRDVETEAEVYITEAAFASGLRGDIYLLITLEVE
jgi:hypothetical protein